MNWSSEKSITLTKLCIVIFAAGYIAVLASCPWLLKRFVTYSYSAKGKDIVLFMATVYSCAVPLGVILWNVYHLVNRIGAQIIFTEENIRRLRLMSWMCFTVTGICLVSMSYYIFYIVIAACAAFMGLLLRVIKNVFVRAKDIKEENDFTI